MKSSFPKKEGNIKKKQARRRNTASAPNALVRATWTESRVFCGPYPETHKRFYKIETLRSAVEKALAERDRFFYAGIQALLGTAPLSSLVCDLVYEDATRLVFLLTAANRARKRGTLRYVVAKNHQECSVRLLREYESLTVLHRHAPEHVIEPWRHGVIFLPDRHRRRDINREIFGYLTKDVPGIAPLYVASQTQFAPHDPQPRRFSEKDSEQLKMAVTAMVAALYDERTGVGVDPVALYPECLGARVTDKNAPTLLLLQCRQLRKRMRTRTLIHNLLFGVLRTGAVVMPLAPARPDHFLEALSGAVTPTVAQEWCLSFLAKADAMEAHTHEELLPGRDYLDTLEELVRGA